MTTPRVLVAGIGNVFFGDDGFGVAVAQRMLETELSRDVTVRDFGIRGMDLAFALMDNYDQVIIVDAMAHGGAPGELIVIEPEISASEPDAIAVHDVTPDRVLAMARKLGAELRNVRVVGCEPALLASEEDPQMELSDAVREAIDPAIELVLSLITSESTLPNA